MQMDWKRFSLLLLAGFSLEVLATATGATVLSGVLRAGEILVVLLILGMATPRFLSWLYQEGQELAGRLRRWNIRPGQKALVPREELLAFLEDIEGFAQRAQGSSRLQGEALARLLRLCGVSREDEPHIQLTPWALYQLKHCLLRDLKEVEQYERRRREQLRLQVRELDMQLVQLAPAMDHPGLLHLLGQMRIIQQLSTSYPAEPLLILLDHIRAELEQLCQQRSCS
uniref:Uncharacterized protein n=1 Tax=Thermogemmatispora argillosa TaxID=2045280 RepID=A0A455SV73_9CHLR|nr:hypothetical protein KTA_04760 [Thermogemmatispora argillosa]